MKTSNYILIAFFTFTIGATLVLSITAIGHEDEGKIIIRNGEKIKKEKFPLPEFKVLVVENDTRFCFEESDNNAVEIAFMKDSIISPDFYRISGDTLIIDNLSTLSVTVVIYGHGLSSLIAKNEAYIRFNSLITEHLQVSLDHAELSMYEFQITSVDIQAVHSQIRLHQGKLDTLSARLTDESSINCSENINKVIIEKDPTSNCNLH